MADSRVVTTTTHSFHPKALSFSLSLSLSLVKTGAGTIAASFYSVYSFEREDPPLISSIHFLFVFLIHFSSRPLEFLLRFFTLGRLQTIISFCERAHHFLKVTSFSLSLFFARSQHHLGDDFDDARPTFAVVVCGHRPTRSRALGNERV